MSNDPHPADPITADQVFEATELLEAIVSDRGRIAELDPDLRQRFLTAAGRVSRPDPGERRALARAKRKLERRKRKDADETLLATTGIRTGRDNPIFLTPRRQGAPSPQPVLGQTAEERVCYVCRSAFHAVHHFYDQLCVPCGDFNFAKRSPSADLRGRTALVTGARVKIGYQAAMLLLQSGCRVLVLTRFPHDAARRYAAEPGFAEFSGRLQIYGIDLRHVPAVEELCAAILRTESRLDFLINNACQTVRRPPGFYDHLMQLELQGHGQLTDAEQSLVAPPSSVVAAHEGLPAAALSQVPLLPGDREDLSAFFPEGRLDADLQQVDLREVNSWRLRMHEVPTLELIEVHLVNAVAPYLLNARLKPLLARVETNDAHVVNVSAMEGQFYRTFKSDRHPHTNMAKASLNMMTRTAALDYVADGIHMNSVDTGWVTDEDPVVHAERKREMHGFHPPLDIVDGAARIVDPVFNGVNTGTHVWGQFLKDYRVCDW